MAGDDVGCGEVSLELNAYRHPATGEYDGMIRGIVSHCYHPLAMKSSFLMLYIVISVSNLKGLSGKLVFPFI